MKRNMSNNFEARIPVLFLEEGDKIVAYSPALDLSTFGKTEKQAKKRFTEAAMIFVNEIMKMGTVDEVLEECGWHRVANKQTWSPPIYRKCEEELVQIPVGAY